MGAATCCEVQAAKALHLAQSIGPSTTWPVGQRHPQDQPGVCPVGEPCGDSRCSKSISEPPQSLREYTYAVEAGALLLESAADDPGNLSYRSNVSDLDRQAKFLQRKLEVAAKARQAREAREAREASAGGWAPFLEGDGEEGRQGGGPAEAGEGGVQVLSKYKALGINVVAK
mmetsp:Transcript_15430/g.49380  ORF Transcript_15430/g.49380 Transcript_15430/m.49380 type:complete len:172 (-) Transcript_15430:180-695(-)